MTSATGFWQVLKEAWEDRAQLGESRRSRQQLDFLAPALEIQERPPSPLGRWLGWSLMVLFAIAVVWATVGSVNIVAVAEGKIIPGGGVKQIQPLQKGVIQAILVQEGQLVTAGTPLIELDQALTDADQQRLLREIAFTHITLSRLRVLQQLVQDHDSSVLKSVDDIHIHWDVDITPAQQQRQTNLLWQEWLDYHSRRAALESQSANRRAEANTSLEIIKKLETTLPIITRRTATMKASWEKNIIPEVEFLALEQQRIEQRQDLAAERSRQQQLQAAIAESRHQIATIKAEISRNTLNTIADSEQKLAVLQREFAKASDINAKQILYAPVKGKVQQLAVHTVGGVVTDAQTLMLIVPEGDYLEVDAVLENKDIGFVNKGQQAEIKIHTFPFTRYGVIDAEIVDITGDAVEDEQRGFVYKIRLKMASSKLYVNDKWVDLLPGMAVTAEVKTGRRKLIDFVLAPLLRYKDESVRER